MQPPSNFDFSEYSSSRDGADTPSLDPSAAVWGSEVPTFGFSSDPFGGAAGPSIAAPADMFATLQTGVSVGVEQGRTPIGWAAGAAAVALVGLACAVVAIRGGPVLFATIGWFMSWPAAYLLAKHISADTRQRTRAVYQPSVLPRIVYWSAVAFTGLGIVLNAWQIADWAGRL